MIVPVWAAVLAHRFWEHAGAPGPFPRDLSSAIESAFDVAIKHLPNLSVRSVREWLSKLSIATEDLPDRLLRGCLATSGEVGFLFMDSDDSPDDRRFTLAHELAHYLRDVRRLRGRIASTMGRGALEVVDGRRLASETERLVGVVLGVELKPQLHLFLRDPCGLSTAVVEAEDAADRLAYELLAPASHLVEVGGETWSDAELRHQLVANYGLPEIEAQRYAAALRPRQTRSSDWLAAIRSELQKEATR